MQLPLLVQCVLFFFFNDTAPTEIYTLSLHDALPIYHQRQDVARGQGAAAEARHDRPDVAVRSEEHTSELQSRSDLVCRLLLAKIFFKYSFLSYNIRKNRDISTLKLLDRDYLFFFL